MLVILEIQSGLLEGVRGQLLPGQSFVVGRGAPSNLIVPDDKYLSTRHCLIENKEDRCVLRDLNSTNGTWLNDQRVQECKLLDGDVFVAGTTRMTVQLRSDHMVSSKPRPHFATAATTEIDHQLAKQMPNSTVTGSIRDRYSHEDLQRLAQQEETECFPLEDLRKADPEAGEI